MKIDRAWASSWVMNVLASMCTEMSCDVKDRFFSMLGKNYSGAFINSQLNQARAYAQ